MDKTGRSLLSCLSRYPRALSLTPSWHLFRPGNSSSRSIAKSQWRADRRSASIGFPRLSSATARAAWELVGKVRKSRRTMTTSGHPGGALPRRGSEGYVVRERDPAGGQPSHPAYREHSIRAGGSQVPRAPDSHARLMGFSGPCNPAASAAASPAFGCAPRPGMCRSQECRKRAIPSSQPGHRLGSATRRCGPRRSCEIHRQESARRFARRRG